MKKIIIAILIAIGCATTLLLIPGKSTTIQFVQVAGELPHRQEVWIHALEWCESNATDAINPKDKDSTPSYYYWQFKPATFKAEAEKYGIIKKGLTNAEIMVAIKDYENQHLTINAMVRDGEHQNWEQLFPACVKKLGRPPL
jgi:hypothetical protein